MMWKKSFLAALAMTVGVLFAPLYAQEADSPAADTAEEGGLPSAAPVEKPFTALFKCTRVDGIVRVLKPGASEPVNAEEGRFYPMGTVISTVSEAGVDASGEFAFGQLSTMKLVGTAEILTCPIEIGEPTRTVELRAGRVLFNLPRALKEGMFFVRAPFFGCSNLAGESQFDYQRLADGDEAVVRCVTGSLTLEDNRHGHYRIPRMAAANQVRIRCSGDNLHATLRGESGDCKVELSQGLVKEKNIETGEEKEEKKTLVFSLSPRCAIKVFRRNAPKTGNMIVSIMTLDASGKIMNHCAFAEGRSNVNSGELVIAPASASDAEKAKAKAAAEETEEVEVVEAVPAKKKENANADGDDGEAKNAEKEENKDDAKDDDI